MKAKIEAGNVRRVVIVDDHPIMREGFTELVNNEPDLSVCGEFSNARAALDALPSLKPDIAIVDLCLPGEGGIDLIKDIRLNHPEIYVLVLSMYDETLYAERVLRAGASGYVMKQEATEKVLDAIRDILKGKVYLSEQMGSKLMHQLVGNHPANGRSAMERLSDRELEVFGLIGQGRSTRQIAEQLHLSVKTVESHRAHIKEKLNIQNSAELLLRAVQLRDEQHQGFR